MIRTIVSIIISFSLLVGISIWESAYVNKTFQLIEDTIQTLYEKTEDGTATHEDGEAVETFWQNKKHKLLQLIQYEVDNLNDVLTIKEIESIILELPK